MPLLVSGPGVPAGVTVELITANVDFAPTFAEIAGIKTPQFVDGRSLVPFLSGTTPPTWRQALLLEHAGPTVAQAPNGNETLEPPDPFDAEPAKLQPYAFAGLRTDSALKYLEYNNGEHELYDLNKDPAELDNVYDSAQPELKARLSAWLGTLRNASGQALRDAEAAAP